MKEKINYYKLMLQAFLNGETVYGAVHEAEKFLSLGMEGKFPLSVDMTLFLGKMSYACQYQGEAADSFSLIPRKEPLTVTELFRIFRLKITEDVLQGVFFFYSEMAEELIEFTDIDEFDATLKCFVLSIYLYRESQYLQSLQRVAAAKVNTSVVKAAAKELAFLTFGGYKTQSGTRAIWMDDMSAAALIRLSNHPDQTLRMQVLKRAS